MATENDSEDVVRIKDALETIGAHEEEAIAVLGAGDEDNCTYSLGFMERQAVFSCVTCDPLHENLAGICYGCSLKCHEEHDLIELYTKRKFRCDCGNEKFGEFKCKLQEKKDGLNSENKYNHNFAGKYCTCGRPYPDPDEEIEDEMIQCVICEDWFHSRHLGALAPAEFSEMICDGCVKKHSFLQFYTELTAEPSATDISKPTDATNDTVLDVEKNEEKLTDINKELCLFERLKAVKTSVEEKDLKVIFWKEGWRNSICQCNNCLDMYNTQGIGFIISEVDTVAFYERKGKENVEKVWEEAANKMSQMNRVQQIEIMQGFHELKSGLQDFLRGFKENDVVRKEDVETFFEDLNKRKRQRLEEGYGIPPGSCKN